MKRNPHGVLYPIGTRVHAPGRGHGTVLAAHERYDVHWPLRNRTQYDAPGHILTPAGTHESLFPPVAEMHANPHKPLTIAQVKKRAFALGNTHRMEEAAGRHARVFAIEDEFNQWQATLTPAQQKVAGSEWTRGNWHKNPDSWVVVQEPGKVLNAMGYRSTMGPYLDKKKARAAAKKYGGHLRGHRADAATSWYGRNHPDVVAHLRGPSSRKDLPSQDVIVDEIDASGARTGPSKHFRTLAAAEKFIHHSYSWDPDADVNRYRYALRTKAPLPNPKRNPIASGRYVLPLDLDQLTGAALLDILRRLPRSADKAYRARREAGEMVAPAARAVIRSYAGKRVR